MPNLTKKNLLHQVRKFKNSIFQFSHLPFADILSTDALEQIVEHSGNSRDRIFTPLVTLKAFIFQVLSTDGSCRQAVELSGKTLHQQAHKSWLWKGHNTLLTDGTTVLMPDTPKNQTDFPQQSNQKPGLGFPIARIVGLI